MATFGNTNIEASTFWRSANQLAGLAAISGGAGTIAKFSAYVKEDRSGAVYIKAVLTDIDGYIIDNGVSDGALVGASYGWVDMVFSIPPSVLASTQYILWIIADSGTSNLAIAYVADSENNPGRSCANDYVTPYDATEMASPQEQNFSIYATYSSGAAGPANLKSYNTNLKANIKSINTNLIANVKSLDTNV